MTGQQLDMLTADGKPLPRVEHRLGAAEQQRLGGKCAEVLDRLRQGPATGAELAAVAGHRFGGRICELREAGYQITSTSEGKGRWRYELVEDMPK